MPTSSAKCISPSWCVFTYILCADAMVVPKFAKLAIAFNVGTSPLNIMILSLLREGLWKGFEDEAVKRSLGSLSNFW
jgi:hypothetical protein